MTAARLVESPGIEAASEVGASKSERAYRWIRDRIERREFSPGYRLVLGSIAEALQMSVVPVREAIRRLEAEGLVTFERNIGARVAVVDELELVLTLQTLGIVEGAATALSAPQLHPADLDRALGLNRRMERLLDHFDPHTFTRLNQQFHTVLFTPCPNPQLLDQVQRGWQRLSGLRDSTFAFVPGRSEHSVAEHDHIVHLIRTGADPLEIELAARRHRWATMDAFCAARHLSFPTPNPSTTTTTPSEAS